MSRTSRSQHDLVASAGPGGRSGASAPLREFGRITHNGLHLRDGLTFEAWLGAGRQIARISTAAAWWLGDWLVYGEREYGQKYKLALETSPLGYQTLRNYAWVARRFDMSRRRDNLSFQHHAELAALPEADQDLWLERAERLDWSRNELRRRLAAERQRNVERGHDGAAVLRLRVEQDREKRWREAAHTGEQDLVAWIIAATDDAANAVLRDEPASTVHLPV